MLTCSPSRCDSELPTARCATQSTRFRLFRRRKAPDLTRPPVADLQRSPDDPSSPGLFMRSAVGWTTGTHAIAIAYRLKSQSAFPLEVHSIDPPHRKRPHRPRRNGGDIQMLNPKTTGRYVGCRLVLAGIMASSTLAASTAVFAGACPADKFKADVRQPVSHAAKGVTDTVLAAIDLEKEPAKLAGRQLRLRKLTIEPGGIVPWHSHGDRPALIYIAEGEINEYASNCSVPLLPKTAS